MSKILESLPLTIVAGVILTIIMAFATESIVSSSGPSAAMEGAARQMDNISR
ncbi:MAG: hypothetical protein WEB93_06085 [Sphingomonadales bacterium]